MKYIKTYEGILVSSRLYEPLEKDEIKHFNKGDIVKFVEREGRKEYYLNNIFEVEDVKKQIYKGFFRTTDCLLINYEDKDYVGWTRASELRELTDLEKDTLKYNL